MTTKTRTPKYKKLIEIFITLAKRVLPKYSGKFSRRRYTQYQHAAAVLLMRYENKPYRDIVDLLPEFSDYFKFRKHVPHYTTLQKFFARTPSMTWDFMLSKTYRLFHQRVADIAVDSTGFSERHMSHYYRQRMTEFGEKTYKIHRFLKHSIAVDSGIQAIVASAGRQIIRNDNYDFKRLVKKSRRQVRINYVTADKGYDSEANHVFVRERIGGISVIPIRKMGSGVQFSGFYRAEMRDHFPDYRYHQRSKVETVNFVQKVKFGSELRNRSTTMRKREMKATDVVYNVYRYMKLKYNFYLEVFYRAMPLRNLCCSERQ